MTGQVRRRAGVTALLAAALSLFVAVAVVPQAHVTATRVTVGSPAR